MLTMFVWDTHTCTKRRTDRRTNTLET